MCGMAGYVYFFSDFYYSEILAFLFIIHGISLVNSGSISSWLARRKMSELHDQTAKPKRMIKNISRLNQTDTKFELKLNTRTREFIVE